MQKSGIRQDVQVVRGLAILVVVAFHFYPKNFPNGYLGVDQFFVISGYLMCMLLKKVENSTWYSFIGYFYYRRMKRIMPLYLMVILLALTCIQLSLTSSGIDSNVRSARKSLLFISNDPGLAELTDYFNKLSTARDFFTHTWSLSVEVQFYLMVPFMFLLTKCVAPRLQLGIFAILGLLSFLFHVLAPRPEIAFKNVFARIWQFVLGMIVYLKSSDMKQRDENGEDEVELLHYLKTDVPTETFPHSYLKNNGNLVLFVTVVMTTYSTPVNTLIARVFTTCSTALFIYCSSEEEPPFSRLFQFFGDISFALYLFHWPLYAFWKMFAPNSQIGLALTLAGSIGLSIMAHLTFEKWSLKLGWKSMLSLVTLLAILNTIALKKEDIETHFKLKRAMNSSLSFEVFNPYLNDTFTSYDQVEVQNRLWQKNDFVQLEVPGSKTWVGKHSRTGLPANGQSKFMIIGSSTAANLASLIQDECGFRAKEMIQVTLPVCEPLYPTEVFHCIKKLDEFHEAVATVKPDYLFIGGRYLNMGNPLAENITTLDYDHVLAISRDQLQKYMRNVSQKIIMIHAFPRPMVTNLEKLPNFFKENVSMEEIDELVVEPYEDGYNIARERYDTLLHTCGRKCDVIDYTSFLHNSTTNSLRYFDDTGLSYFTLGIHLTPLGLEIARPTMTELCKRI